METSQFTPYPLTVEGFQHVPANSDSCPLQGCVDLKIADCYTPDPANPCKTGIA